MTVASDTDHTDHRDPTDDAFLGGALAILQPKRGYRAGLDAVVLAAAAGVGEEQDARVLDAGAGTGVAGLCVARRCPSARVTLAEREPALVQLAIENAARNGLAGRVQVVAVDVARGGAALHSKPILAGSDDEWVRPGSLTHAIANPPYQTIGRLRAPADPLRRAAHTMAAGELDGWLRFLATALENGGIATMIHRADALAEVLAAFEPRFGALRVRPLVPRADAPAGRIVVQGRKDSRAPLALLSPVVLHEADGSFTPLLRAVLMEGAALPW